MEGISNSNENAMPSGVITRLSMTSIFWCEVMKGNHLLDEPFYGDSQMHSHNAQYGWAVDSQIGVCFMFFLEVKKARGVHSRCILN